MGNTERVGSGSGHWPQFRLIGNCDTIGLEGKEMGNTERVGSGSGHWPLAFTLLETRRIKTCQYNKKNVK